MNDTFRIDVRRWIAVLLLLPDCDMACRFCASPRNFSTMAHQQAERLLQSLTGTSIRSVVLGGGEPFLWPHDPERLARIAHDLGFTVQVCTNGITLPERFPHLDGIDRFILPLESLDSGLHDSLRARNGGHHQTVLTRLQQLTTAEREFTVSTVVTRENIDQIDQIGAHLGDLHRSGARIHAWHLYRFLPLGRGGALHADRLTVPIGDYRLACARMKRANHGFPVYRREHMLRSRSVEFFHADGAEICIGHPQAPATSLAVTA